MVWHPSHVAVPDPIDALAAIEDTDNWWCDWLHQCTDGDGPWRDAIARSYITLKALTLRADRRHCRGADDVAAGAHRRRAQLGLSLLLAARRDVRAVRADERRLHGGGARLARLAAARGGRRSVEAADHVRPGRRAPPDRIRSAVAARLRRLAARAHRQRRGRAVAARRLRRGDGHAVPRAPRRHSSRSRIRWRCSARCWSSSKRNWRSSRTKASGKCAVRGSTSRIRRSWPGSRSIARSRPSRHFGEDGPVERWRAMRDAIHTEICAQGYDAARRTFTQYYGSTELDASLLMMPLVGFLPARRSARARHRRGDRARADARRLPAPLPTRDDGEVTACRPAKARSSRARSGSPTTTCCSAAIDEARALFERLLALRNDVGLLSEEYDPVSEAACRQLPAGVLARRADQHRAQPVARQDRSGRTSQERCNVEPGKRYVVRRLAREPLRVAGGV